VPRQVHWQVQ